MSRNQMTIPGAALAVAVLCWAPSGTFPASPGTAFAAESLNIDGLPKDAKAYRVQVDQILTKVDGVIIKLKDNANAQAVVLDLEQTRDNILREIPKMDMAPGDAKWGSQEMRDSVHAMLKLMKEQYDKASALAR